MRTPIKQSSPTDMLSINEVSNLARCGRKTVADAIKNGKLPALKLGKRLVRIRRQDVEAWLAPKEDALKELMELATKLSKAPSIPAAENLLAEARNQLFAIFGARVEDFME